MASQLSEQSGTWEYVGNFNSSTVAGRPVSDYACLRFNKIVNDAAAVATNDVSYGW